MCTLNVSPAGDVGNSTRADQWPSPPDTACPLPYGEVTLMTAPAVDVPEYSQNGGAASVVVHPAGAVKSPDAGAGVPGRCSVNSRTRALVFDVIRTAIVVPGGTSPIDNVVSQYPPPVAVVSAEPQSVPTWIAEPG